VAASLVAYVPQQLTVALRKSHVGVSFWVGAPSRPGTPCVAAHARPTAHRAWPWPCWRTRWRWRPWWPRTCSGGYSEVTARWGATAATAAVPQRRQRAGATVTAAPRPWRALCAGRSSFRWSGGACCCSAPRSRGCSCLSTLTRQRWHALVWTQPMHGGAPCGWPSAPWPCRCCSVRCWAPCGAPPPPTASPSACLDCACAAALPHRAVYACVR
jgi:hypothetical protein